MTASQSLAEGFTGRIACIVLPSLALQILLRREPEWRVHPVAVVDADKPQGKILQVDERAFRNGVRIGQRYAAGLSLCSGLRAGVVENEEVVRTTDGLVALLRRFSPEIEPAEDLHGVFWLEVAGLDRVYASPAVWAEGVAHALREEAGWRASVAIGFERFRSHVLATALAVTGTSFHVCRNRADEIARTDPVPLARLPIDPKLRDALERLGVTDVGDLRALPEGGLLARFGADGARLQRIARGGGSEANLLVGVGESPRYVRAFELDPEQHAIDVEGLILVIGRLLDELLRELAAHGAAIVDLQIVLRFDRGAGERATSLQPAEATLDVTQLLELVRLRLTMLEFREAVVGFELEVVPAPASREQLELFGVSARRDLRAANRAIARVCAELGTSAVVYASLRPGHLPEAGFQWLPFEGKLERARPEAGVPCLVRRILSKPRAVQGPGLEPDGWFVGGSDAGPVRGLNGPYVVSGGWWRRQAVHREYHFAETRRGDVLWLFEDRDRRRWFVHGVVE